MSQSKSIAIVSNGDDGEALYINGVLITDGHQVTLEELAEALGHEFNGIFVKPEWTYSNPWPLHIRDIPPEAVQ